MNIPFRKIASLSTSIFLLVLILSSIRQFIWVNDLWHKYAAKEIVLLIAVLLYVIESIRSFFVKDYKSITFHPLTMIFLFFIGMLSIYGFPEGRLYRYWLPFGPPPVPPSTSEIFKSILKVSLIYCAMLLGMISDWILKSIGNKKRIKDVSFSVLELIRPLLVSPMVFLAIWSLLKDQPFGVVHFIVAYQNGFFWQSILNLRLKQNQRTKP